MPVETGRDLIIEPYHQDAADRGEQRRESIGRDAVGGDVVADRLHAARIIAHALQREPKRRARDVKDHDVTERGEEQDQVIERQWMLPVDPKAIGAGIVVKPAKPLKIGQFCSVR